jgi:hypothetical protein
MSFKVRYRVGSLLDALFSDLVNLGSAPPSPEPQTDPSGRDPWQLAAEDALKQQQQREKEQTNEEVRQRQRFRGD